MSLPANNAPPAATPRLGLGLALLAVAALRLWHLPGAGLPDYDSVRNWQVAVAMAAGDWRQLFSQAGPGFFLFYGALARGTASPQALQLFNALLGVVGVGLFAQFVVVASATAGRPWRNWEAAALVLLGGTGLLLTVSGRDLTSGAGSLVVAAGLMRNHFQRLQAGPLAARQAALVRTATWLAVGLCYNYKFLLAMPILGALEAVRADGAAWWGPTKWRVLWRLALPYVVLGAVGALAVGLPWYRWLAAYVRLVLPAAPNPAGRQAVLSADLFYYFRYLLAFESPLLLPGLVVGAALGWRQWRMGPAGQRPLPLLFYLGIWAGCWLGGMSLLLKAPRGLFLAYLPLVALVVLCLRAVRDGWPAQRWLRGAVPGVLIAVLVLNCYQLWANVYRFPPSNFSQAGAWLRAHGARRVATTVGLGVVPYLPQNVVVTAINDERALAALRRQGYDYVVLDAYWRPTNIVRFDSLQHQPPLAAWPEARLTAPLLFLEHSEYTGRSFAQTLALQRVAAQDSLQIRLYRLAPAGPR